MTHSNRSLSFSSLLAALALLAGPALAADPDLSTPTAAATAFAVAVEKGDAAAIKAASVGKDEDYQSIKVASDVIASFTRFVDAAGKKFGDAGKLPAEVSAPMSSKLGTLKEKIEGDTATLIPKDGSEDKHPIRLTKTGATWKVDLKALNDDPDFKMITVTGPKMIKALDDVTAKVASGKYKDAQEAFTAFGTALAEATAPK